MTQPADPGYRETRWGQACVAIHERMLQAFPDLRLNVGKDERAATQAAPLLSFDHDGEAPVPPLRGGGGHASFHPVDRMVALSVEVWGRTKPEAELIYEELARAVERVAPCRGHKFGKFTPVTGSGTSGNLGAKFSGKIEIRISVLSQLRRAVPTSHTVTGTVVAPDGTGAEATALDS